MEACRYLLVIDTAWMDEWMDKQMKGNRRERTRSVDPDTHAEGRGVVKTMRGGWRQRQQPKTFSPRRSVHVTMPLLRVRETERSNAER